MEPGVSSGLRFILIAFVFAGFLAAFLTRGGLWTHLSLVLEREGLGWGTVAAICVAGIGGVTVAFTVGSPPFGEGSTVSSTIGGILFLVGTVLVGRAIGRYPQYRLLSSVDETTVRDCDVGETVVLTGTVDSDGDLVSPHTETPCVAYDARVETGIRTLRFPTTFWLVDDRRTDGRSFSLRDETGTLTVDPTDSRVQVPVSSVSSAETPSVLLGRVVNGATVDPEGPSSRYVEGTLELGDPVRVVGRVIDGQSIENGRSRCAVDAESLSVGPTGERGLRTAVRRDGPLGLGLFVGGFALVVLPSLGL